MFWLGATICFALWVAYGIRLSRRSTAIRASLEAIPRNQRILRAVVLLVGSLLAVFVILGAMLSGGALDGGAAPLWVWPIFAAVGVAFVHAHVMGTAMLVTLAQPSVTRTDGQTSRVEGLESDETSPKSHT